MSPPKNVVDELDFIEVEVEVKKSQGRGHDKFIVMYHVI